MTEVALLSHSAFLTAVAWPFSVTLDTFVRLKKYMGIQFTNVPK